MVLGLKLYHVSSSNNQRLDLDLKSATISKNPKVNEKKLTRIETFIQDRNISKTKISKDKATKATLRTGLH